MPSAIPRPRASALPMFWERATIDRDRAGWLISRSAVAEPTRSTPALAAKRGVVGAAVKVFLNGVAECRGEGLFANGSVDGIATASGCTWGEYVLRDRVEARHPEAG